MIIRSTIRRSTWVRGRARRVTVLLVAVAFAVIGSIGVGNYVGGYWLYRGFAAPSQPKFVTVARGSDQRRVAVSHGAVETITFAAPALGGRRMSAIVYLPAGYSSSRTERYPVFYLLHGTPGSPSNFVDIGDVVTDSNTLLAEGRIKPMILVMPEGSTGFFSEDNEWANAIRPDNAWETYVATDVVGTIDARFRAIISGRDRGIGGLSEGGYGAVNIALHHPGEFDLIESWSGYFIADKSPYLFARNPKLLAYNSPSLYLKLVAKDMRTRDVYFWLYAGRHDGQLGGTARFAIELTQLQEHFGLSVAKGHHNWALWRSMMPQSLTVASRYFVDGSSGAGSVG